MTRSELHITLGQMLEAFGGGDMPGAPVTTEAFVSAAVEVSVSYRGGQLVPLVAPPASAFVSGVQNPVHRMEFTAVRVDQMVEDAQ
ncbi:hypothetical protein [Yoonia sp.]|uniref:hypothetical protein n=1 Tax=Yoonia sp. TaxID=2212373 RepID=UPI00358E9D55